MNILSRLLWLLISSTTHADSVQWLDSTGQFRLIMLEKTALLYGSNQRSGPNCPKPGSCAFVLRGRIESAQTLVFEPLKLSATGNKTAGLEGHQSELPAQLIDATETVWSLYIVQTENSTDTKQARLTCISPQASCAYFVPDIMLEQELARARHP